MSLPGPVVARPIRIAQAFVVFALVWKLWLSVTAPPIGDEAYYWLWGQRLDWSYFDHPPLHAWLLRAMSLFGWNTVALRLLTWLTLAGSLWIFWLWAKRLKPEDPAAWWWPSVAVYLSTLLFFLMSGIAFHDHLLIFLCLATGHAFLVFAEQWEDGRPNYLALYGAAVLLGLTVLTKYNGVLLGIGIALFFIAHRPVRSVWRSPHLYLAALLSVAMQAPVVWWNLQRGFVSYNFHFSERWAGDFGFRPVLALLFVVTVLVVMAGAALLAPQIAPWDPARQMLVKRLRPPAWEARGLREHPLGTDHLGRDILSRIVYGGRISLGVGLSAVTLSALIGVALGLLAGFHGGRADALIMRDTRYYARPLEPAGWRAQWVEPTT